VGFKRDEITVEWRKLCDGRAYDLHCSPNIVRVIKSRRMKWAEHVARTGDERGACSVLLGRSESRRLEDLRVNWMIILKCIKMFVPEVGWGHGLA
jgi:hypothetical protein